MLLTSLIGDIVLASVAAAGHAPEPLELGAAQGVQAFVSGCMLDEAGLVAESVVAILPHAVEVGLVLPVVAVGEPTVLVEPEAHVTLGNRLVLHHAQGGGVEAHLLGVWAAVRSVHALEHAREWAGLEPVRIGHAGQRVLGWVKGWWRKATWPTPTKKTGESRQTWQTLQSLQARQAREHHSRRENTRQTRWHGWVACHCSC